MSTIGNWQGVKIIKNGLVLYIDPSSPNSYYNKTSSTIKDISGSSYVLTLNNRPLYDTDFNNSLRLNGSNQYIIIPAHPISSALTLSYWVYIPTSSAGNGGTLIGDGSQSNTVGYIWIFLASANGLSWQFATNIVRSALNDNTILTGQYDKWINLSFVGDYSNPNQVTLKTFINGVLNQTTSGADIQNPLSRTRYIGTYNGSIFNGVFNIGMFLEYSRALSDVEVLQNYNNTKSRFGL